MMSIYMKKAYAVAEKINKDIPSELFKHFVMVKHEDGSSFFFRDAVVLFWIDSEKLEPTRKWYLVFTEHFGFHVYDADDCDVFQLVRKDMVDAETILKYLENIQRPTAE